MSLFQPRVRRCKLGCLAAATTLALGVMLAPGFTSAADRVSGFGENPGDLVMYLHRPADAAPGLPLVVALHGCLQSAGQFDDETGLVSLAEETPFLLLLPEQRPENMSRRCFRWYDGDDNRAGQGESASIRAMVDHVMKTEGADPDRVFVLGLSAGGAMAAVLMANYPDLFAGGAILAGLPFGCNRPASIFDVTWYWLHYSPFALDGADASYACGIGGFGPTDRDAEDWAEYVFDAAVTTPDRWPMVSLWQGSGDGTVDPDNLAELTEQWTAVHGIDAVPDATESLPGAVRELHRDAAGVLRVETWSLDGFSHAVPIDTDGDPDACGSAGDFILDADICAVRRIADFWQLR